MVYFISKDLSLDRLFHEIQFDESKLSSSLIKANGSHFCNPDNYTVNYEFYLKNSELNRWTIEYNVKGPKKDYKMLTCYSRS